MCIERKNNKLLEGKEFKKNTNEIFDYVDDNTNSDLIEFELKVNNLKVCVTQLDSHQLCV